MNALFQKVCSKRWHASSVRSPTMSKEVSGLQENTAKPESLTMWIILRKDLSKNLNWSTGSLVAQAAHASTAVLWKFQGDPNVRAYMEDWQRMHKVVLQVKNESQLLALDKSLTEANFDHLLWQEEPEEWPTCIATKPYYKSDVKGMFSKCSLYR